MKQKFFFGNVRMPVYIQNGKEKFKPNGLGRGVWGQRGAAGWRGRVPCVFRHQSLLLDLLVGWLFRVVLPPVLFCFPYRSLFLFAPFYFFSPFFPFFFFSLFFPFPSFRFVSCLSVVLDFFSFLLCVTPKNLTNNGTLTGRTCRCSHGDMETPGH